MAGVILFENIYTILQVIKL